MLSFLFNAPRQYPKIYANHYDRLGQFYNGRENWLRSIDGVPRPSVYLFSVHWLHLEVYNGGFWQFFFNSTGVMAPEAKQGFAAIGMKAVAEVVSQAMERVANPYPFDRSERQQRVGNPDERLDFDDLNKVFWDLADTESFFRRLPKFVPFADAYAIRNEDNVSAS
jgi:hypothetical protein